MSSTGNAPIWPTPSLPTSWAAGTNDPAESRARAQQSALEIPLGDRTVLPLRRDQQPSRQVERYTCAAEEGENDRQHPEEIDVEAGGFGQAAADTADHALRRTVEGKRGRGGRCHDVSIARTAGPGIRAQP